MNFLINRKFLKTKIKKSTLDQRELALWNEVYYRQQYPILIAIC